MLLSGKLVRENSSTARENPPGTDYSTCAQSPPQSPMHPSVLALLKFRGLAPQSRGDRHMAAHKLSASPRNTVGTAGIY